MTRLEGGSQAKWHRSTKHVPCRPKLQLTRHILIGPIGRDGSHNNARKEIVGLGQGAFVVIVMTVLVEWLCPEEAIVAGSDNFHLCKLQ